MIEALGIAMVKNEADVIEAFIRHNLGFMDALVILNNDSIDGTREILAQLEQEGLPIILFNDPVVGFYQAEKVTAVYRKVVPKLMPRFVFLLDADEFVVAQSRETLYAQLRAMAPGTQARYYWRTYIPAPTGPEGDPSDPLRSITHRKVAEHPYPKSVIVTQPKIDMRIKITEGGHDVMLARRSLPAQELHDVVLAHFPVRTIDQLTGKALVAWIAHMEQNRHRRWSGAGFHWKALYERIVSGPGLTAENLTHEALIYAQRSTYESKWPQDVVHDPVVPAYAKLTVRPPATCTPLQKVVRCVEKILSPEADSWPDAIASEFLWKANRVRLAWREFAGAFMVDREPEMAFTGNWHAQKLYVDLAPREKTTLSAKLKAGRWRASRAWLAARRSTREIDQTG
jgi:hypothetical protein